MKLTKAIVLPIASAALVVASAGAVLASTTPSTPVAGDSAVLAATTASTASPAASPVAPYLKSILDRLVANGTISATQEQAIIDAWVAGRQELRAERQQLRSFLSDGVLTTQELAQLPATSPLQQLKPLMTDGQITVDQLRRLGRGILHELRMGGQGMSAGGQGIGGLRGLLNGNGVTGPSASPSTGG